MVEVWAPRADRTFEESASATAWAPPERWRMEMRPPKKAQ